MDMAVSNLFKHKAFFQMRSSRGSCNHHPDYHTFHRGYESKRIENLRSVGVTDINELCMKCLEPFMVYTISQFVKEETEPIDSIRVYAFMHQDKFPLDIDYDFHNIFSIKLDNPNFCLHTLSSNSEMTIHPIDTRLFDEPFYIHIDVYFEFMTPMARNFEALNWVRYIESRNEIEEEEEESDEEEEPYTPPVETYRQDCCVVCLESKPNILYLDCMHIAICDSCDRLKKTGRNNCDVCRAEISKRVKI